MITDPRQYSTAYPGSNIILNQAQLVLDNKITAAELEKTIANMLRDNNDALINVALNLAPSFAISELVWYSLETAMNSNLNTSIFAIPLVLVMGSKTKAKINSILDTEKLNDFFKAKDIFVPGVDIFVSGKLVDPLFVSALKPSQLYYWGRNLESAKLWLPVEVPSSNIEIKGEAVFLRFLIGVATIEQKAEGRGQKIESGEQQTKPNSTELTNNANVSIGNFVNHDVFRNHSMELMQLINNELKNDHVTLFSIPFAPVTLSSSYVVGDEKRTEIAISVAFSNIAKKIREVGLVPVAIITTEMNAIKITLECAGNDELKETSLWHLKPFTNFKRVFAIITELLEDMQIKWSYSHS